MNDDEFRVVSPSISNTDEFRSSQFWHNLVTVVTSDRFRHDEHSSLTTDEVVIDE